MPDTTTHRRPLGATGLEVSPLCLGTNSLGWAADEPTSFDILDAYVAGGGNFLDTAHTYSGWVPGNEGGESETIIGRWLADRGRPDDLVIATKVGMAGGRFEKGLRRDQILGWVEGCLARLQVDRIDLFYTHEDDPGTPLEETLGTLDELVRQGVVSHLGASNLSAERLAESLRIADEHGWARYSVVQPHYNLLDRAGYEGPFADLCVARGLAVAPYPALGGGFLTGKYRPGTPPPQSVRAGGAGARLDARGIAILEALDRVAAAHGATPGQVAIAWVLTRPAIVAALASASSAAQVQELLPALDIRLDAGQVRDLEDASAE